ncbi:hypothetical protein CF319_g4182 [Tilletia indica]|uniref:Tc1-like transposase DDE domain-containing protein n=1 Tax=Tilletia indica TaxID=43049 RepID=A0A177TWQ7_9BASI|nr:hypothetical protein CF319_g4182 [Tilletia indica]KAE8250670.1 hypothetical protein A4X13_0g4497 [Tilletia indica]
MPSTDLKLHFVHQYQETGKPLRQLVSPLISSSTGGRALAEVKQYGAVKPQGKSTGAPKKLPMLIVEFVIVTLKQRPSIYQDELVKMITYFYGDQYKVDQSTISRLLKHIGFSKKNLSVVPIQQDEEERRRYVLLVGQFDPWQLVFADESSFNNRTALRPRGWAPLGEHAIERQLFLRGERFSLLPALSMDGLFAPWVTLGSVNGEQFLAWVKNHLMPYMNRYPGPRSVLILDNCRTHKKVELRQLLESHGHILIFLPRYSPGYNPIELAFASIKRKLKREREPPTTEAAIIRAAQEAVTPEQAQAFFRGCGYTGVVEPEAAHE